MHRFRIRLVAPLLSFLSVTSGCAPVTPTVPSAVPISKPAATFSWDGAPWILSTVRPDGAIATNPDQRLVWPYFSNLAAVGLAQAAGRGNSAAGAAAWRWLEWYGEHQNLSGVVNDFEVRGGTLTDTGHVDSTDATAGMFLVAAARTADAAPDQNRLRRLEPAIKGALSSIAAMQDVDGLTWAKPTWHVKYLMDNVEVRAGLLAAVHLAMMLGDSNLAADATARATRVAHGLASLWNPTRQSFDWAVHPNGVHNQTDWRVMYPDSVAQMWMVSSGISPSVSHGLVDTFIAAHPNWDRPEATDVFSGTPGPVGYWPMVADAFRSVGKDPSASLGHMHAHAESARYGWPFTSAVASEMMATNPLEPR